MRKLLCAAAAAAAVAGVAQADSITTLFGANNGGSNGGAVYFDITVLNPAGIEITGYDTNTAQTVQFGWTVFIIENGNFAGNETNQGAWTQVATGTGVGMGVDNPSPVTLDNTFVLPQGTHAMALVMGPEAGHDYTNGDGTNQSFNDGNVQLDLGSATNVPFTGNVFTPRVWNGTIHYDVVPAPGAVALLGLAGLATRRRRRA